MLNYNKIKLIKDPPPKKLMGFFPLKKDFAIELYLIKTLLLSLGLNYDPKKLVQLMRHELD